MGKKVQCCFKVKRSKSSSSSSSSEHCPTVIGGSLITTVSVQGIAADVHNAEFFTNTYDALTNVANAFTISGVVVSSAYITPLTCDRGTAEGYLQWGALYLVEKAAAGCQYPYVFLGQVSQETTGTTPASFSVTLRRNQALAFVATAPVVTVEEPYYVNALGEPTYFKGTAFYKYTFYPRCLNVPCISAVPLYM